MRHLLALALLILPASVAHAQVYVQNVSGSTLTNQPVSIEMAFVAGQIATCVGSINFAQEGGTFSSISTVQTDVRNRWPDGSLKLATVSFLIPSLANNAIGIIQRVNGACNNTGFLTAANMLSTSGTFPGNAGNWNFDAQIQLTGTASHTISARTILSGASSISDCTGSDPDGTLATSGVTACYWLKGPIVTAIILEDRSGRSFDVNTDGLTGNPLHPMFECWFYPQTGQVECGYILENEWASATAANSARDQTYSYVLTGGNSSPITLLTQATETVLTRTRWHHRYCIQGTGAGAQNSCNTGILNVNLNWGYLAQTQLFPNWDPVTFQFNSAAGYPNPPSFFTAWTSAATNKKDAVDATHGIGFFPAFHTSCGGSTGAAGSPGGTDGDPCTQGASNAGLDDGGAAYYHGPLPTWDIVTLMTSDPNMMNFVTPGNSDAAGGIGWWFRDADTHTQIGRYFDAPNNTIDTLGRIVSINARTQLDFNSSQVNACSTNFPTQQVNYGGVGFDGGQMGQTTNGLDTSHWPETSYTAYLISGRYNYYEQVLMQGANAIGNSGSIASGQGACVVAGSASHRQGAFGYAIYNNDQDREVDWAMRQMATCATVAVDGSPEHAYCLDKLRANMAVIEGQNNIACDIPGVGVAQPYCGAGSAYAFGQNPRGRYPYIGAVYGTLFSGSTAYVGDAGGCPVGDTYPPCTAPYSADANFMNAYTAVTMGWLNDLGYCPQTNGVCALSQWESNGYINGVSDPKGPGLYVFYDYILPTIGGTATAQQGITNVACVTIPCAVSSGSLYPYYGTFQTWPRPVQTGVNTHCADEGYGAETLAGLSYGYSTVSTQNANTAGIYNGTFGFSGATAYNTARAALITQCKQAANSEQPPFVMSVKWDIVPRANAGAAQSTVVGSPAVTFNPTSIAFNNVLVSTASSNQVLTITNTGTATLNLTTLTVAPSGPFQIVSFTCGTTLPVNQACTVTMNVTPLAAGPLTGTFSVTDNAAGSPQTVPLTATGILTPSPGSFAMLYAPLLLEGEVLLP